MNDLKALQQAMANLAEGMARAADTFKKFGAAVGRKKSGKTRRGATHKQGKVFRARKKFDGTPAQYRRQHKGLLKTKASDGTVVKFVPNYKQKHAAPRARNVWTSQ